MQIFSRLNAGERNEMPNVRWCVLKALAMYHQMPTAVVKGLEHDQKNEHERHRKYSTNSELYRSSSTASSTLSGSFTPWSKTRNPSNVVVDIERDRRFGSFSRTERINGMDKSNALYDNTTNNNTNNNKEQETNKTNKTGNNGNNGNNNNNSNGGNGNNGNVDMNEGSNKAMAQNEYDNDVYDEYEEKEEEDMEDGLAVCEPPTVAWSDVSQWVVQQSCITVDLRHCTAEQHHWLVQRYDGGNDANNTRNNSNNNNAAAVVPVTTSKKKINHRFSRNKKNKKSNSKTNKNTSRKHRTSFLHIPFVPKDMQEATDILTNLTVLVREWYVQNGYVVLVTWEDDTSVVSVASALMRAGIPRVCKLAISPLLSQSSGSLLSGSRTKVKSPRSQRKWKRNLRRRLSETNGPLVF